MDSCIQSSLDNLNSIFGKFPYPFHIQDRDVLEGHLSFVRTYYAFGRIWGESVHCESAMRALEEIVYGHSLETQCLWLSLSEVIDHRMPSYDEWEFLQREVEKFAEEMRESILRGLNELRESLYDVAILQRCCYCAIETEELLGMLDSLLQDLGYAWPPCSNELPKSLGFLKNLIRFAIFRRVGHRQMRDIFIHIQRLVVDVAEYIFPSLPVEDGVDQLVKQIKPVDYHVCEIYVRVLEEASETSESSNHATPESRTIMLHMVDSLLFLLSDLLFCGTIYTNMFEYHMNSLYVGLRLLRTTLRVNHDKLDELHEKMHNLIGVLICEETMIVCYLCVRMGDSRIDESLQHLLFDVDKKIKLIKETVEKAPRSLLMTASYFPQTNLLGFIEYVLEKMNSLNIYEADSEVSSEKNKFSTIYDDLSFVRSFLSDFIVLCDQNEKVQFLWSHISAVTYETEFVLDSLAVGSAIESFVGMLISIIEQFKLIKAEASELYRTVGQVTKAKNIAKSHIKMPLDVKIQGSDEHVVGMDDEAYKIIDGLTRGTKQLDVIAIVGMAGIGKTTVAKKVYCDVSIVHYFHVHAWCTISQVYNTKTLLIEILRGIDNGFVQHSNMSEDDLTNAIRKHLKRRTYLIILDDVWDIEAWNSVNMAFPNDTKGSRILITSRNHSVALQIALQMKSLSQPFHLRSLTDEESWELFRMEICLEEGCPPELIARAKAIAQQCKGLPLTIIIVAGLIPRKETIRWDEIEETLSNTSALDHCKESLELSYRHLPEYLKPCFLYFAAYKEDQWIRVRELLWLWIAEGFIKKIPEQRIEDVAEGYLAELIQRNLVMIAESGSKGNVKFCIVHDLLHEFCREKSTADNFLNRLRVNELDISSEPNMSYRLHISSRGVEDFVEPILDFPYLRTLFIVTDKKTEEARPWYGILYRLFRSKLLRVLDLMRIGQIHFFPGIFPLLGHLKYLTLIVKFSEIILPPSIANLSNLETLILGNIFHSCNDSLLLPNTMWKMKNLRHLQTTILVWTLLEDDPEHLSIAENLQSLSRVLLFNNQSTKEAVRRFPNIRMFKCELYHSNSPLILPLDFLIELESLSIRGRFFNEMRNDHFRFPPNLKKLTLEGLGIPWSKISIVDRLSNLEVLKLQQISFIGDIWDMQEGAFPKLRFLKLECLDIAKWTDSDDTIQCLQKLVLRDCEKLNELPSRLAEIPAIQMIEVSGCNKKITNSLKKIRETQMEFGNKDMKIRIDGKLEEDTTWEMEEEEEETSSNSEQLCFA